MSSGRVSSKSGEIQNAEGCIGSNAIQVLGRKRSSPRTGTSDERPDGRDGPAEPGGYIREVLEEKLGE
jgi:hypothetical protein